MIAETFVDRIDLIADISLVDMSGTYLRFVVFFMEHRTVEVQLETWTGAALNAEMDRIA